MTKYPPYACDCCGVANGDMFWDYIQHNKKNFTYAEVERLCDEFDDYRAHFHKCNEEVSEAVRTPSARKPYVKKSPYWEQFKKGSQQ